MTTEQTNTTEAARHDGSRTSSEGLGPLPEPAQTAYVTDSVMRKYEVRAYTATQMRAYAAEQMAAERERCEKLESALWRLLDGSQHCGEMQWCGIDDESPWEAARAAMGPNVRGEATAARTER